MFGKLNNTEYIKNKIIDRKKKVPEKCRKILIFIHYKTETNFL